MNSDPSSDPDDLDFGATLKGLRSGLTVFRRFSLERQLGRGGMGVVWLGHDERLDRAVALKFLPETVKDDPAAMRELREETRRSLELTHPHIVRIYDWVADEHAAAISMEYVDGHTLSGLRVRRSSGVFEASEITPWIGQLCEALAYAHRRKIVHRDLKPSNLMVDREDQLRVMDFGIAGSLTDSMSRLSAAAMPASGTLVYMSPQQAMGCLPSVADDIYSLGATIYELLTGKPPFYRGNIQHQIETVEPPSMAERRSELGVGATEPIPERWERTIAACLAKDPAERPAGAQEVWRGLTEGSDPVAAPAWETDSAATSWEQDPQPVEPDPTFDPDARGPQTRGTSGKGNHTGTRTTTIGSATSSRSKKMPVKPPRTSSSAMPLILSLGAAALVVAGGFYLMGNRGEPQTLPAPLPKVIVEKTPQLPVQPTTPVVPVPVIAPVKTPEPVVKVETPKAEAPTPPVAMEETKSAPAISTTPQPVAKPENNPATVPELVTHPLASVPGLKNRLEAYLTARRTQLADLATKYGRGLDSRLNQAADAGDLKLTTAYDEEKARVTALVSSLAAPVSDPRASISQIPALPELPGDAPETLVALRQTWTSESGKILATLDGALQQSLQALESELTKARDLEKAKAVLAYRESLAGTSYLVTSVGQAEGRPELRLPSASMGTQQAAGAAALQPSPDLARATKDAPFENSLGMKFVPVKDTDVLFCIHEVRYKDYAVYAAEKQGVDGQWKNQSIQGFTPTDRLEDHPVMMVSWDDAQGFCAWLSEKEGKIYRLPTDREWSIAVGIGRKEKWDPDTTPSTVFKDPNEFPWGDDYPPPKGAGNFRDESVKEKFADDQYLAGYDDNYPTTAPVMSFEPNKLGLYDLGGNVGEWCEDWYDISEEKRVLRGSPYNFFASVLLLSSHRVNTSPSSRFWFNGFRVVVETAAPPITPTAAAPPGPRPVPASPARQPSGTSPDLARATKDVPFENSLGMKFVPVPGTDVLFCIHEVRYKDYEEYTKKAKESVDGSWTTQTIDGFEIKKDGEDHPVTGVNWDEAKAFCKWLSEKEGKTYRLPTDQEWSRAVGIGDLEEWKDDTTPATVFQVPDVFPWGDEWPPPSGAGNYSDASSQAKAPRDNAKYVEGGYDDGFPTTAPVMSFEANKLGLYDLGGNVWEWCEDLNSGEHKERVLRGGSWRDCGERGSLLSSYRARVTPDFRGFSFGIRVVLETVAQSAPPVATSPPSAANPPVSPPSANRMGKPDPALARATKDAPYQNTLGMKFVPVSGTKVLFCVHETRYKDYAAYATSAPGVDSRWKNQTIGGHAPEGNPEDHPVINVSWNEAREFASWLGAKEGVNYRLPTDQEWSFAVGIGRDEDWSEGSTPVMRFSRPVMSVFPWGEDWPPKKVVGNYSDRRRKTAFSLPDQDIIVNYDDGYATTAPVMSFQPNRIGIYDLGGNVWEWCEDAYSGDPGMRVLRGGSWWHHESGPLHSSVRVQHPRDGGGNEHGFRLVIEIQ